MSLTYYKIWTIPYSVKSLNAVMSLYTMMWLCHNLQLFCIYMRGFLFMSSIIPAPPAYGVYISQLILYSRACASYQEFIDIGLQMTRKLLSNGFLRERLESSLHQRDLVDRYKIHFTNDN